MITCPEILQHCFRSKLGRINEDQIKQLQGESKEISNSAEEVDTAEILTMKTLIIRTQFMTITWVGEEEQVQSGEQNQETKKCIPIPIYT